MRLGRKLVLTVAIGASFGVLTAQPAFAAVAVNVMKTDRLNASTVEATGSHGRSRSRFV